MSQISKEEQYIADNMVAMEMQELLIFVKNRVEQLKARQPFNFHRYKYLLDIYDDKSQELAIEKSAQMGLTAWGNLDGIFQANRGLTHLYYLPSNKLLHEVSSTRLKSYIALNPKLSALIGETDSVYSKRIGLGILHFKLLSAATEGSGQMDVISTDADSATYDEYDLMPEEKIVESRGRLMASEYKLCRYFSTPRLPDTGINRLFKRTDQKYWLLQCTHCNEWNCLEDLIEQGKYPGIIEQGFLACGKCNLRLDVANCKGQWVPKKTDKRRISGYHVCRLYDPLCDYEEFYQDFTTTRYINRHYNERLGLPYSDSSIRLSAEDILAMCLIGRPIYSSSNIACTMGVDIGGAKGTNVVITRPGSNGKLRDIVWLGVVQDLNELDKHMIDFNIKCFVIDGKYERIAAKSFIKKHRRQDGWLCDYTNQDGDYKWSDDRKEPSVKVNRTQSLDRSQYLLRNRLYNLPDASHKEVKTFAEHCANIAKSNDEDEKGNRSANYLSFGDTDYRHALNYDAVAWYDGEKMQETDYSKSTFVLNGSSFYTRPTTSNGNLRVDVLRSSKQTRSY